MTAPKGRTERLPRCGRFMPIVREGCARVVDHDPPHRSRYDLDNLMERKRGHLPWPWIDRGEGLVAR